MGYKMTYNEKIEEDKLNQIMEQNISYLDQIAEQMKLGYVSVFAGAGLSVSSGYVDWKRLLEPLCKQMRLDINNDLTEIAQYYKNQYGRQGLNDVVFNEFAKVPKNNVNVSWLAKLPIKEYWTTNYDDIIEREIEKRGKVVEVIINQESFKYHDPRREVVVYKMHGDKKYPDDVVLTKEDYQKYDEKRELFTKLLSVELVRKTFLFIGFSFNDPNLERILSIAKYSLKSNSLPKHYCFMRKVQVIDYLNDKNRFSETALEKYIQDKKYQELRISDMTHYGIYTILVDDFEQITLMLQYLYNKYITNNVFISGGIKPNNLSHYGKFNKHKNEGSNQLNRAESFLTLLGKSLIDNGFQIYTGFGAGVGNYILSGVLASKKNNPLNTDVTNSEIHISSLIGADDELKEKIRKRLIEQCSSTIILFGYGKNKKKSGIFQEYKIAQDYGNYVVPVRSTGFAAKRIYDDLRSKKKLPDNFKFLKDEQKVEEIVDGIIRILIEHKKEKEKNLSEKLFSSVAMYGIRVFISYHYASDNKIAKEITEIINSDKLNIFTVVREDEEKTNEEIIKSWADEEIKKAKITILLISKKTLDRKYVSYELTKSLDNGNLIIPILIDSKENNFSEKEIESIENKLCKKFKIKKIKIRRWFQGKGKKNILRWLNKELV
jgi:hypothetical protein